LFVATSNAITNQSHISTAKHSTYTPIKIPIKLQHDQQDVQVVR